MRTRIRCAVLALTAAALLLIACGNNELSLSEASRVSWAERVLTHHCADEALAALGEPRADEAKYENVLRAPGVLIRIFRADPDAIYPYGDEALTMRQVLADLASDMSECAPEITAELDRALAAG